MFILYQLCAYEDAVSGGDSPLSLPISRFPIDCSCRLFTPEEFLAFEYLDDIWFQQFDGPANEFSATLGYYLTLPSLPSQSLTLVHPGFNEWRNDYVLNQRRNYISHLVTM
jgi:hypothetical protein